MKLEQVMHELREGNQLKLADRVVASFQDLSAFAAEELSSDHWDVVRAPASDETLIERWRSECRRLRNPQPETFRHPEAVRAAIAVLEYCISSLEDKELAPFPSLKPLPAKRSVVYPGDDSEV